MINHDKINKNLRELSGTVSCKSKFIHFLYLLLRDKLPAGEVEELVRQTSGDNITYTNGWLVEYAANLNSRLK